MLYPHSVMVYVRQTDLEAEGGELGCSCSHSASKLPILTPCRKERGGYELPKRSV